MQSYHNYTYYLFRKMVRPPNVRPGRSTSPEVLTADTERVDDAHPAQVSRFEVAQSDIRHPLCG